MSFDILFLSFSAGKIDGEFDANRLEFSLSCTLRIPTINARLAVIPWFVKITVVYKT
jgi:hypothetical protein